ncbi:phosphonate C-P lyase system protein PhnG [Pseudooceanicola sediminis]|uniref:Phosphonate C-P lyase system protein PhnG n=1 Tax=Pseudooceanicola sediminis TaxID=2211117 RepID=A0A399J0I5_9RHOB|nr:phosphonate C-P lyase system protein PhnG [Pseudooceanicola sediminis]KAA2312040.1 phosphonate C-P lyase system protein PhnG [Puniceibacterium sp. HSS470]RII38049.1 phosphonate C-P lyase system protein PhnG [Pseudooceanicola sediminis]|tara:strand:+ start:42851 stop:43315 length:465 start_codon:yes stop_codon:yes gene_type:complete
MADETMATADQAARKGWMGLLARAPAAEVKRLWDDLGREVDFDWLRAPEIGGVMVRGRTGGTGAAFNLGEMTVTRCSLRLADGTVGHAMVQGRDRDKARVAALVDALMQGAAAEDLRARLLRPLEDAMTAAAGKRAARAARTKVDFFTMVRGED